MSLKPDTKEEIYRHLRENRDILSAEHPLMWGEISNNKLIMMMSPALGHQRVQNRLRDQLIKQCDDTLSVMTETDLEDVDLGILRIPDVCIIPRSVEDSPAKAIPSHEALLVIEITSPSNPRNDHEDKVIDYARMRIPHYLIVDPRDSTCVHYSGPVANGEWDNRHRYTFGDTIDLGEWKIDTGTIPPYAPEER